MSSLEASDLHGCEERPYKVREPRTHPSPTPTPRPTSFSGGHKSIHACASSRVYSSGCLLAPRPRGNHDVRRQGRRMTRPRAGGRAFAPICQGIRMD